MGEAKQGALSGIRILDLTDERAIYGAKLLADLGATVVRPEPPGGDPLRARGPHTDAGDGTSISLWYRYLASNRHFVEIDPGDAGAMDELHRILHRADIVLICGDSFGITPDDLASAAGKRRELVVIDVTSFGREGPWKDYLAPDLVASALGGICATTGDVETPPLKAFGEIAFMVTGVYTAIAALAAFYHVREQGEGQRAEIPAHETIASCLEHVFMWYWYHERLVSAQGPVLARQGGLHWSKVYDVIPAANGTIMVTLTPSADNILAWLVERDVHQDLLDEKYQSADRPMPLARRMMEVLREWVATQEVESLFLEAQERHCPFGWVMPPERVADNPQLEARNWWTPYGLGDREIRGPGAPYRLSETPWQMAEDFAAAGDAATVLRDIGWEDPR